MRAYAIGDIHGHLTKLEYAHVLIEADRAECDDDDAPVVHIGDLTDRGPNSKGVLDFLINGQAGGEPWIVLRGNHDRMMSWFLEEIPRRDHCMRAEFEWVHPRIGGQDTLASYGVNIAAGRSVDDMHADALAKVPRTHIDFMANLPAFYKKGGVFFCHAGIRPGIGLAYQNEDDLFWIRDDFHASNADHGALIVHGHTPIDAVTHYGNRINIDTGAGYDKELSAIVIEKGKTWLLTHKGRVEIPIQSKV